MSVRARSKKGARSPNGGFPLKHSRIDFAAVSISLKKMRTTAAQEFLRLLRAGESAILHLPKQHEATVIEVLRANKLTNEDAGALRALVSVKLENGLWSPRVEWRGASRLSNMRQQARSALALWCLFHYIECGSYLAQPVLGRLAIRNEILLIWWDLFVIPELESRGHSRAQSQVRSRPQVRERAAQLLKNGTSRDSAKSKLIQEFELGDSQANKVLATAGFIAPRGRKKNARFGDSQ
jgi:hypothetical protein